MMFPRHCKKPELHKPHVFASPSGLAVRYICNGRPQMLWRPVLPTTSPEIFSVNHCI